MFKEKRIGRKKDNVIINMDNQPKPRILDSKIIRMLYCFIHAVVFFYFEAVYVHTKSILWTVFKDGLNIII